VGQPKSWPPNLRALDGNSTNTTTRPLIPGPSSGPYLPCIFGLQLIVTLKVSMPPTLGSILNTMPAAHPKVHEPSRNH
jgi:hypothetical protein